MRRNLEKRAAFCKRFSITTNACEKAGCGRGKTCLAGCESMDDTDRDLERNRIVFLYFQPFFAISCTAALFLAPICSAETPSALNVPNRLRIGLLPKPFKGYSLLASA